jgi:hypothetical protein
MNPTAQEIVSQARITIVWSWLHGPPLRHGRGPAFWRDGTGYNVSLDDRKNAWLDHKTRESGGLLDLICLIQGCSRRDALRWLADQLNISTDKPLSDEEKRVYAQRRERAQALAATLTTFRTRLIQKLVVERGRLYDTERRASEWARAHMDDPDNPGWEKVWDALDQQRGDEINTQIEHVEQMSPAELLALYRRHGPIPLDPDEIQLNRKLAVWEDQLQQQRMKRHDTSTIPTNRQS